MNNGIVQKVLILTDTSKHTETHGELKCVRLIDSNYRGNHVEKTEKSVRVMEGSSYRKFTLFTRWMR